jgi:hypothetical protein
LITMAAIAKETIMLIKVLVLVCNASLTPQDCTPQNAIDVIKAPDASNEVMCAMQAQAYLAQTSLARPRGKAYFKIVCRRGEPPVTTAIRHWRGRQRASTIEARD